MPYGLPSNRALELPLAGWCPVDQSCSSLPVVVCSRERRSAAKRLADHHWNPCPARGSDGSKSGVQRGSNALTPCNSVSLVRIP